MLLVRTLRDLSRRSREARPLPSFGRLLGTQLAKLLILLLKKGLTKNYNLQYTDHILQYATR